MARTPNYGFERAERDKAKAAKKAEKAAAKKAKTQNPADNPRLAEADGRTVDDK